MFMMIISFLSLWSANELMSNQSRISHLRSVLLNLQSSLSLITSVEDGKRGYVITGNEEYLSTMHEALLDMPSILSDLEEEITDAESKVNFNKIKENIENKISFSKLVIETRRRKGFKEAAALIESGKGRELMDQIRQNIQEVNKRYELFRDTEIGSARKSSQFSSQATIVIIFVTLSMLLFGSIYLVKSIFVPVNQLVHGTKRISKGDYSYRIPLYRSDELGELTDNFNHMAEQILYSLTKEKRISGLLENLAFTSVTLGNMGISHSTDSKTVLQAIVDKARSLINADYAAIGVGTDSHQPFDPWVYSGVSEEVANGLGWPPRPVGLLGWVAINGESIKLKDLKENTSFEGFPSGHPDIGPILGVPLRYQGKSIGNIYLAKKQGGIIFSEEDQQAIGLLASHIGVILENVRLQAELQKAISSREDVLAVVSHDLKNPLTIVNLSAEILKRRAGDSEKNSWILKASNNIQTASSQMKRMIADLLDAAAIEADKIQVNLEESQVHHILEEINNQLKPIAKEKNIQLVVEFPPDDILLSCDSERIQQVFSNLIGNALKFTPAGGRIAVITQVESDRLRFSVSDTGPGISEENQKHLFDRYWQVKGTKQRGTGLGLFIAKGIVEAHGGSIEVHSLPGRGSTFSFTLDVSPHSQNHAYH
jgi:signal transduction histidine kinase/CHASE3 domain sensor protein